MIISEEAREEEGEREEEDEPSSSRRDTLGEAQRIDLPAPWERAERAERAEKEERAERDSGMERFAYRLDRNGIRPTPTEAQVWRLNLVHI